MEEHSVKPRCLCSIRPMLLQYQHSLRRETTVVPSLRFSMDAARLDSFAMQKPIQPESIAVQLGCPLHPVDYTLSLTSNEFDIRLLSHGVHSRVPVTMTIALTAISPSSRPPLIRDETFTLNKENNWRWRMSGSLKNIDARVYAIGLDITVLPGWKQRDTMKGFQSLREQRLMQDIEFICEQDGVSVFAHSQFLAAKSIPFFFLHISTLTLFSYISGDYFRAMLSNVYTEAQSKTIRIPESSTTMTLLLDYLYTDQFTCDDASFVSIYAVADKYGFGELRDFLRIRLLDTDNVEVVVGMARLAWDIHDDALKELVIPLMKRRLDEVKQSEGFEDIVPGRYKDLVLALL